MNPTRKMGDLQVFVAQSRDCLRALQGILRGGPPPERRDLQKLTGATRALRGSASLLGLDSFQSFLGRLFGLREDVQASEVPWSAQLEVLLDEAQQAARAYLDAVDSGERRPRPDALLRVEERLASWRRAAARRFEEVHVEAHDDTAPSDSSPNVVQNVETLLRLTRDLHARVAGTGDDAAQAGIANLAQELVALGHARSAPRTASATSETFEEGLRNHCEGALRSLVEAAAQEVLDEARERGARLALRATGCLDEVDDVLGGALLEILRHLWSDSALLQSERREAQIDCVLRVEEDRLVVEVRDPDGARATFPNEEDVLARYPGLRRTRPLVESLQGLVWVQPAEAPGCRFRVALPRSTATSAAQVVRVGTHDVALPASAVEGVHDFAAARVRQDPTGVVLEVGGVRYPVLHLAFVLQDVSYEELAREFAVIVGSFERRAALLASGPCRSLRGAVRPRADGPWLGELETATRAVPLLDVGRLLGRRRSPEARPAASGATAAARGSARVLVVNSSQVERTTIAGLLVERPVLAVQSAEAAWEVLEREPVGLLLCDLRLPEMNAQRLAELRRKTGRHGEVPILLVLSHAGEQSHLVVRQLGAENFVRSPIQRDELVTAVRQCLGEG